MLNILSLITGLCAWLFACFANAAAKAASSHKNALVSFSLCTVSLVCQFFEIARRVRLGDFAAIEDMIRTVLIASVALVVVTVILNLVAFGKVKSKR